MDRFFKVTTEGLFFHQAGVITDVNTSGADMLGMFVQEIIGHDIIAFVSSDDAVLTTIHMNRYDDEAWESAIINTDGEVLSVEMQGKRVDYDDEGVRVLAVRDIRQRKQAEKNIQNIAAELRQFIDTASTLIFAVDTSLKVTEWNRSAERLSSRKKEKVLAYR
ncbi:MAG: PAS domain S-box protein [Mariprofundaceae bacterium]|nr:PAS domain S-box protein [Mariprofundaceae bacterium]